MQAFTPSTPDPSSVHRFSSTDSRPESHPFSSMYGTNHSIPAYHQTNDANRPVSREEVSICVRQQPINALHCIEGKAKSRKPIDPPPITQLIVGHPPNDRTDFLQSPYLFMCASLWQAEKDEPWNGPPTKSLEGSVVSSLHRLRDTNNKDAAFFVFGDMSVKVKGAFRLRFSLFEYQKATFAANYLAGVTSDVFTVDSAKDYVGLKESTYLSRSFAEQGVRLRLRKEPRTVVGTKRRQNPSVSTASTDESNKRAREDIPDEAVAFPSYLTTPASQNYGLVPLPPPPIFYQQPPLRDSHQLWLQDETQLGHGYSSN